MVNNLKIIREEKNKTQEEIARNVEISLSHYRNIEKNRAIPNVEIALKIATKLEVDINRIFYLTK